MPQKKDNDRDFLRSVGSAVLKQQFDLEKMPLDERDNHIIKNLLKMEKNGQP